MSKEETPAAIDEVVSEEETVEETTLDDGFEDDFDDELDALEEADDERTIRVSEEFLKLTKVLSYLDNKRVKFDEYRTVVVKEIPFPIYQLVYEANGKLREAILELDSSSIDYLNELMVCDNWVVIEPGQTKVELIYTIVDQERIVAESPEEFQKAVKPTIMSKIDAYLCHVRAALLMEEVPVKLEE